MKMSKREQRLLIGVLIAAIITGIYVWIYQPAITRSNEIRAILATEREQLLMLPVMEENIVLVRQNILNMEFEIEQALEPLLPLGDEPALLRHLHEIFIGVGGINSLVISDPVFNEEFSQAEVRIAYQTTYNNFIATLEALENSTYRNSLSSVSTNELPDAAIVRGERVLSIEKLLIFYFSK